MLALGMMVGSPRGRAPAVVPSPEKQWLAIDVLWHLGSTGRARARAVEKAVALATWMCMSWRPLLAVFFDVYRWVCENRERKDVLNLPLEVRRELLAMVALLPLAEQHLGSGWCPG